MAEKLMVVIPCYNEEEVLPETSRRLVIKMGSLMEKGLISEDSKVLLVNDGSKDRTWELISDLHKENPLFEGVKLSRNRGHQNALLAGLMTARNRCDICISMDADLQDDMDAMDKFIEKHREGCEIVYGVRSKREKDSFFKRETALMFYRLMSGMGVDIVFNHADYRLMSNRALNALAEKFAAMGNCSVLYDQEKNRVKWIVDTAKARSAKGVLVVLTKFCDPEEFDYVMIKKACEAADLPLTLVEVDRQMVRFEQVRTNLETFRDLLKM